MTDAYREARQISQPKTTVQHCDMIEPTPLPPRQFPFPDWWGRYPSIENRTPKRPRNTVPRYI